MYIPDATGRAAPAPVIVFSHGLGGSRESGTAWGEHWASHGYLSLHLQHAGSDTTLWQERESDRDVRDALRQGITARTYFDRIADVHFVLDELSRRVQAGDSDVGAADIAQIGMSGHSYGAATTLALLGKRAIGFAAKLTESRFKAAIVFSPGGGPDVQSARALYASIVRPMLVVTGTQDRDMLGQGTTPDNRRAVFSLLPARDKYLLVLNGADHLVFNGGPRQSRFRSEGSNTARYHCVLKATTLAFWNAYLRGDAECKDWLRDGVRDILGADDVWQRK